MNSKKNELTMRNQTMLSLVGKQELGDMLKPMIDEIHLFDSFVAGTTRLEDPSVLKRVMLGDTLTLRREVNKFDEFAIVMFTADERKLGYIPEKDNVIFARLLDAGKCLKAKVSKITQTGSFVEIQVGIYLVDF